MMKRIWPYLLAFTVWMPVCFASLAGAPETIDGYLTDGEYAGGVSLIGDELLIVNGGNADVIDTWDSSRLEVYSTSLPLSYSGMRGVYDIHLHDDSSLLFAGGATESITVKTNAIAELRGGVINYLTIYNLGNMTSSATIYCQEGYQMNASGISGLWEDGSPFDIHFDNAGSPFPPTANFVNIVIVPEPATLALLAIGILIARTRNRKEFSQCLRN